MADIKTPNAPITPQANAEAAEPAVELAAELADPEVVGEQLTLVKETVGTTLEAAETVDPAFKNILISALYLAEKGTVPYHEEPFDYFGKRMGGTEETVDLIALFEMAAERILTYAPENITDPALQDVIKEAQAVRKAMAEYRNEMAHHRTMENRPAQFMEDLSRINPPSREASGWETASETAVREARYANHVKNPRNPLYSVEGRADDRHNEKVWREAERVKTVGRGLIEALRAMDIKGKRIDPETLYAPYRDKAA